MIRGLDMFREHFRGFADSLALIGGAACDDWLSRQNLDFRATRDLDIVLILEAVNRDFVAAMRRFISDGGYQIRERSWDGSPVLYRFAKPTDGRFPVMLEIFSRLPDGVGLREDQTIVPIRAGDEFHSLSAILISDAYHELICQHSESLDGISFASVIALIPLKCRAWLDLSSRRGRGEQVDSTDIAKHRSDVFRLAGTLPAEPGPELPITIRNDIALFLEAFPEDSPEWESILASIKSTLGGNVRPAALRSAIVGYFQLS